MPFTVRIAHALERAVVLATRALRAAPDLSVVMVGASGPSRGTRMSRLTEVLDGPLAESVQAARGRWVLVVGSGEEMDSKAIRLMLRGAVRRTAVVPSGANPWTDDPTARMTAAILTAGTAFPLAAARAAVTESNVHDSIVLFRARALAALNRVPIPAQASAPDDSATPAAIRATTLLDAAAAIGDVPAAGQRFTRAVVRARSELVRRAGQTVRDVPGARRQAIRELGARIDDVDLPAFNDAAAKELAILYAAPPFLDTGGFVSARRLAARGEAYDAVVQDMGNHRPRDDRSADLVSRDLGRVMVARGPVSAGAWPGIEQYCRSGMAQIDAAENEKGEYRSVYSRSMWVAPAVLAAWYKVRHPNVPWTAEFSDPLSLRTNGLRRPDLLPHDPIIDEITLGIRNLGLPGPPSGLFFDAAEWMVYSLADRIIFTNENQRELMLSAYPEQSIVPAVRERSSIEHHPVPEERLYEMGEVHPDLPRGRTTIGYFGTFYDVRGVGDLVDPLSHLTQEDRDLVAVLIFTPKPDVIRKQLAAHPAADAITVLPALGYFDFLATARQLDWLVVADTHRAENFPVSPYLPSKYADYRGSGTRIWGIVDEGSVLSTQPLDARSPLGDLAAAADVMRRIADASRSD